MTRPISYAGTITGTTAVEIDCGEYSQADIAFDEGSATGTVDVTYRKSGASEQTVPDSNQITLGTNAGFQLTGIVQARYIKLTPNITGGPIPYFISVLR